MVRKPVLVVLTLLSLLVVVVPPPSAAGRCSSDDSFETLDVVAEARRDVYRIGETALVDVRVTDSLTGAPEEDVTAGIMIEGRRDRVVLDVGKTDRNGHVIARLHLRASSLEPGWARSTAGASDPVNTPVYCTGRYGYRDYPELFRIRR